MSVKDELGEEGVRCDVRANLCAGAAAREKILLKPKCKMKKLFNNNLTENTTSLEDILLNDIGVKERNKLMKRIPPILKELKTNDLDTARSFLGLQRYSELRKKLIIELNEFAEKDLKMEVIAVP